MATGKARAHAFTLIELLVVVAILALLVTMLIPFLTRARSIAMRAVCLSNQAAVARTMQMFVTTHGGRGPGYNAGTSSTGEVRGRGFATALNVEVLGMRHYWENAGGYIQWGGYVPQKGWLYCPSIRYWGDPYPRACQLNRDVSGGGNWWAGAPKQGPYGILVANPPSAPIPDDGFTKWDCYCLGPMVEKFPRPSYQFLLTEGEVASDDYLGISPYGPLVLNAGGSAYGSPLPAWVACGGWFAFRHVLPPDVSQYQQQATAVFLYIDCHVNYMNANNPINSYDRYSYAQ